MGARSRFVRAFCAVLATSFFSLAAPAAAAESPVFRANPLPPPRALPSYARGARIAQERVGTLFGVEDVSPIVAYRPAVAEPADERDFALEMLDSERRALALSLYDWSRSAPTLDRRRQRASIAALYAASGFTRLWSAASGWSAAAQSAALRLRAAPEDGLDLRAFAIPATDSRGAPTRADELALSEAVAAYVWQASGGRIDPARISPLIGARPTLPDAGEALARVAAAGAGAGELLQGYNPPHYGYRLLREKLAELRASNSVSARDRFAAAAMADAPSRRLRPSSGGGTSGLEAEVVANMERWRWLPRALGDDHVEVNIPEFELAVVRDGAVAHRTKVIVGKQQTPTPIFSNALRFIIVNPFWNVPQSIVNKEMLPKNGGDLSGLAARGWRVAYRNGQVILRQPPGEKNALGRIKFMFPNNFSVYLHDTPSRGLFAATRRAFSHGCMRVDDPFALAEAVLGPGSGWTEERVKKLIGDNERYIYLKAPLPIHIEYFTAFVDDYGRLQQREDLYGYSARVRHELGLGG